MPSLSSGGVNAAVGTVKIGFAVRRHHRRRLGATVLAIRAADASGITLVAIARGRDFEIFSHRGGIALC
jgi:hypothetical protein